MATCEQHRINPQAYLEARVVAFVETNREALLRHRRLETDTPTLCEELLFPTHTRKT